VYTGRLKIVENNGRFCTGGACHTRFVQFPIDVGEGPLAVAHRPGDSHARPGTFDAVMIGKETMQGGIQSREFYVPKARNTILQQSAILGESNTCVGAANVGDKIKFGCLCRCHGPQLERACESA